MTISKFEDLGISREVLRGIRSAGWTEPTPIQAAAVPIGLEGSDLLAQAQTGTGKTGTYGSIILSMKESGMSVPSALVLVPTRELAIQVTDELGVLAQYSGHTALAVYGGVNIESQIKKLKKGVDIIVACPGRLKDLIDRKSVDLTGISTVVLDEADEMLNMGFAPSVNYILDRVPKKRQTMLFSATLPPEVKKLATKYMINYREALVSKDEPTLDLTSQFFIMTNRDSKRDELETIIRDGFPKMIVFCRTKRKVDYLARKLRRDGFSADGIHGDVPQNKRERIITAFRNGDLQVLIASDLASRGLDIDGVDVVVNLDIPTDPDTYIHRIGRTGRAGQPGRAITFVNDEDVPALNDIEKKVGRRIVELDHTSPAYDNPPPASVKERGKQIKKRNAARKEAAAELASAPEKAESRRRTVEAAMEGGRKKSERTLDGALDKPRKERGKDRGARKPAAKPEAQQPRKQKAAPEKKKPAIIEDVFEREPGWQEARNERREGQTSKAIGYTPQGVPEKPQALHAYVQIDRAPLPEKETTWDRLELSVGSDDGADVDKLTRFIIRTAGIASKDIRNVHVFADKSRVQVIRYRSQEVVDEVFGQTFNNRRRVLVTNLSDKKD
ncbi:MAG: DEAD/DEAH box helicase [Thermoplasmata archaeon]|nr:DEAD/DEAH box helicase [Thermoplasmata archaeon]